MKSIKGLSFYNSEGSLIDVEELYAQVQQLEQDSAAKIIIGETASTTSTTTSDIDELAGTETDISLTNADDFKAGDMGISVVTVTDRNNSHGFMVFSALADEPDQPAETLHVRFIAGIYNGKNGSEPTVISEAAYAELLSSGQVQSNTVYLIEGTSDNTLSATAATTSYDNTSSGLTATNVQSAIDELVTEVSGKQDTLTFDSSPTQGSNNPVTSAGIYTSLQGKQDVLTLQALATLLGLTQEQLNNLITFTKSITSATTGSTTISGTITADTFNTSQ